MSEHPDPQIWWKHRRRHSYMSLGGLFALPVTGVVLKLERLTVILPLLQTMAWVFFFVILTYIVAATGEDIAKIRGSK